MDDPRLAGYLQVITATSAGQRWYGGASLFGALRGVRCERALWTPPGLKNSIWRLVLHIAYWEYRARCQLAGTELRGEFRRPGTDFPALPADPDEEAWRADVALLKEERALLVQAIEGLDPRRLDEVPPQGERWTYGQIIEGVIHHDIHHTAQIQLLKRLTPVG
jgi:uncharacterized damage-inducible protein DinB